MRFLFILLMSSLFSVMAYADDFAITSTSFLDQGAIPTLYTCDGKNISPEMAWTNPPPNTKAFALVVSDPDAPKGIFYHWIVYNIPAATKELPEGLAQLPKGAQLSVNHFNKLTYAGPCPPKGTVHNYLYTLYALNQPIAVDPKATPAEIVSAIKANQIKSVVITAIYSRWAGPVANR